MKQDHAAMILAIGKLVEARDGKLIPMAIDTELCRLIDAVRQAILAGINKDLEDKQ